MKTFGIHHQDLKKGYILEIDTINQEDLRTAEVSFEGNNRLYRIWFNGKLIHSSKTFKSVINRLSKLDLIFPLFNNCHIQ